MTTIPQRIHTLQVTLDSLARQQRTPDQVYIHVPPVAGRSGAKYDLDAIGRVVDRAKGMGLRVSVNRIEKDLGPITKIVPVLDLEHDPGTNIILVDDDVIYHPKAVAELTDKSVAHFPAVGFSGRMLNLVHVHGKWLESPKQVAFLETVSGVRYHRGLFPGTSGEFQAWIDGQVSLEPLCAYTDDILIGMWLAGVPLIVIPGEAAHYRENVWGKGTPQLWWLNVLGGNNTRCMRAIGPCPGVLPSETFEKANRALILLSLVAAICASVALIVGR